MIKTNSKKAIVGIRAYILLDSEYIKDRAEFDEKKLSNADDIISYAFEIFCEEKAYEIKKNYGVPTLEVFRNWAQGLALGNLFCYYYNRSAVDDLGAILEETEAEKSRYSEAEAEELLTRLIFREMQKAYNKKH